MLIITIIITIGKINVNSNKRKSSTNTISLSTRHSSTTASSSTKNSDHASRNNYDNNNNAKARANFASHRNVTQQVHGVAVNGFDPQVNARENPHLNPIDIAQHNMNNDNATKSSSSKERNERQQCRAKKHPM